MIRWSRSCLINQADGRRSNRKNNRNAWLNARSSRPLCMKSTLCILSHYQLDYNCCFGKNSSTFFKGRSLAICPDWNCQHSYELMKELNGKRKVNTKSCSPICNQRAKHYQSLLFILPTQNKELSNHNHMKFLRIWVSPVIISLSRKSRSLLVINHVIFLDCFDSLLKIKSSISREWKCKKMTDPSRDRTHVCQWYTLLNTNSVLLACLYKEANQNRHKL